MKKAMTKIEGDALSDLSVGHRVEIRHDQRQLWLGTVDMTDSRLGFMWIVTDHGERKLVDIAEHAVWSLDA